MALRSAVVLVAVLAAASQLPRPVAAGEDMLPLVDSLLPAGFVGGKGALASSGKGVLKSVLGAAQQASSAAVAAAGAALPGAAKALGGAAAGGGGGGPDFKALFAAAFQLLCPVLPVQVPPFPIKTNALCASTGLDQADNGMACAILDTFIGSMVTRPPFTCKAGAIAAPRSADAQGRPVPRPLADRRVKGKLPASFQTKRVLEEEGGTYAWLYRRDGVGPASAGEALRGADAREGRARTSTSMNVRTRGAPP
jgi:hypothetical protein